MCLVSYSILPFILARAATPCPVRNKEAAITAPLRMAQTSNEFRSPSLLSQLTQFLLVVLTHGSNVYDGATRLIAPRRTNLETRFVNIGA